MLSRTSRTQKSSSTLFQRLNTNTVPLNAQELRNCVYRGSLNELLKDAVLYEPWLGILRRTKPDKRMRDEELVLRFYAFHIHGLKSYRTPQKYWLNDAAKAGQSYAPARIARLRTVWEGAIDIALTWFDHDECFRRSSSTVINRALFDWIMSSATKVDFDGATSLRTSVRKALAGLLKNEEFNDLISRAVDHSKRTQRRFAMWNQRVGQLLKS